MAWYQHEVGLPAVRRGFHIVTDHVERAVPELSRIRAGLMHVFILHTSASISINENADPDVPLDLELAFNEIARDRGGSRRLVVTIQGDEG